MNELLLQFLEACKKDKKSLLLLKDLAIKMQQFELASHVREFEKELFPESEIEKEGKKIRVALRMAGIDATHQESWTVYKTILAYEAKKGEFSLNDAEEIEQAANNNFIDLNEE